MIFDYTEVRLGDIAELVTKGTTPTTVGHAFQTSGVNFVKSESIGFDGRIDPTKFAFIDTGTHAALKRSQLCAGDVLFSMAGVYIGKTAVVPDEILPANTNQAVGIIRLDQNRANPKFIDYYIRNPSYNRFLNNLVSQSAQPNFNLAEIKSLPISLPSLDLQIGICELLGCLDDRITLLRQTNSTLEAIAQALFKSWFVDFDPVRAKAEGLEPQGMDAATAALFPDTFEETELGLVPSGWSTAKLGTVCDYLNRGISPKYVKDGGVLVINQKCIRDFSVDYTKARRHDPAQRKIDGRILEVGDVLVNSTGVGTLGRVAQVLELPELTIVDSHVTVVRAGPSLNWPFLGQWMVRKQPEIEAMGEGSTGQTELAKSKLAEFSILIPSAALLTIFEGLVKPLKSRVALNGAQATTLTQLRDTLLPRLISGQLRLPEAEAQIEEACA